MWCVPQDLWDADYLLQVEHAFRSGTCSAPFPPLLCEVHWTLTWRCLNLKFVPGPAYRSWQVIPSDGFAWMGGLQNWNASRGRSHLWSLLDCCLRRFRHWQPYLFLCWGYPQEWLAVDVRSSRWCLVVCLKKNKQEAYLLSAKLN